MTIPFLDLGRLHASIGDELDAAYREVMASSRFVGSETSRSFEEAFAAAHHRKAAVGCGSGTDALTLALRALEVGPGDEVIVPSFTFIATAEAVVHVGASPVMADVDPVTLLLDEAGVGAVRTPDTRAVIPVHLFGHLVPFEQLRAWRDSGLIVLEDAAQAHLGRYHGEPVGTVGHATTFSFFPGKNLGALGDAGAVVSDDLSLIDEISRQRDHGRLSKYEHGEVGWCSRLDGLQAALLEVKLRHLPEWTAARDALADRYREGLEDVVPWEPGAVHHLLVTRVDRREQRRQDLADRGIATGVHYPMTLSDQPALARWSRPTPAAAAAAREVLSLPLDPLMSVDEVDRVVDHVAAVAAESCPEVAA